MAQKKPRRRRVRRSVPGKVLQGYRAIFGGKIPDGAMSMIKRNYNVQPRRANPRKKKAATKKRISMAPIAKVLREAGVKKVRVLRNRAGKPTGLRF